MHLPTRRTIPRSYSSVHPHETLLRFPPLAASFGTVRANGGGGLNVTGTGNVGIGTTPARQPRSST
ncbi:MAG: hypothetical protein M3Y54_03975 [Bacteroidota bacterium]|nr:hypothetical protein [Bacteroidota bacterium]